jgi:hypothetical protein
LECECILFAGANVMLHRLALANTRVLFLDHTDSQDASRFYGCRPEEFSNTGFVGRGFSRDTKAPRKYGL